MVESDNVTMNEIIATSSAVQFSSTVTVRVFDDSTPTLRSHICPTTGSTRPPQPASSQTQVPSDMMTRANSDISNDRKVQRRVSIAAVLSFQNYLRKRSSSNSSSDADLLQEVASKFSQRARDLALERARLTYCEVYQPVKGSAPTIPVQISKYPSFKRKSDASGSQYPKSRRLTMP